MRANVKSYKYFCYFSTILEMIKRREKAKKEMLQLTIEIMEKRYLV